MNKKETPKPSKTTKDQKEKKKESIEKWADRTGKGPRDWYKRYM